MSRFIEGQGRNQATLFPDLLDDFIAEDNAVRVIDVFVDELDLAELGFEVEPAETGRPGYHPATMLKLYIYGYLNQIHSSRRLEREARRNVELMWLTQRLAPDFKTIADFRRDNGKAIRQVCREFVEVCRRLDLFTDETVAIDGSKFKAVNNRDRNFTPAKMKRRMEQIDESIARYLHQIASADRQESDSARGKVKRLKEKIAALKKEVGRLKKLDRRMMRSVDGQISLSDPDARSMATSGRGTGMVGYNVQIAVDTTHHLIVAHEVTNQGHDRHQLFNMARQAQDATEADELTVVADRGYSTGDELLACDIAGIRTYVPRPDTSGTRLTGFFGRLDFRYVPETDEFICPAGQRAIWRFQSEESGHRINKYWSSFCPRCRIRHKCTSSDYRRLTRWEFEDVVEQVQDRLDREPERMTVRRQTAEHPFGTLKSWMGYTHFKMRTLKHVATEMSLHVLAYNMKRMMAMFGTQGLIEAIRA